LSLASCCLAQGVSVRARAGPSAPQCACKKKSVERRNKRRGAERRRARSKERGEWREWRSERRRDRGEPQQNETPVSKKRAQNKPAIRGTFSRNSTVTALFVLCISDVVLWFRSRCPQVNPRWRPIKGRSMVAGLSTRTCDFGYWFAKAETVR